MRKIPSLFLVFFLIACAPTVQGLGEDVQPVTLTSDRLHTSDGRQLPVRQWHPETEAKAIIIGVHGFNDYGHFLNPYFPDLFVQEGYHLITYDQRGFGENEDRGLFSSPEALSRDLATLVKQVRLTYQPARLYLLGESMGGAVVATTLARYPGLAVDGAILSAPAVWSTQSWPWYQRLGLQILSHLAPSLSLSGGGIVQPTDNLEVWKAWSRDPLVLRGTRIEALWGVSLVMDQAVLSAPDLPGLPLLVLYGAQDEIIPKAPTVAFLEQLGDTHRFVYYPQGWHMLPRDLHYQTVFDDIRTFLADPSAPMPSGFEDNALKKLKEDL